MRGSSPSSPYVMRSAHPPSTAPGAIAGSLPLALPMIGTAMRTHPTSTPSLRTTPVQCPASSSTCPRRISSAQMTGSPSSPPKRSRS
ncbi:hypothetical protein HU200_006477 [Digitaria exilis]|uniref:Uncharacterized protein n=1 Tax=Digitaria exilis TaxID=1010633 RepID=A0A835KRR6_9POAL|nr:hypothetical protein HU200_006477 [Digitaria exilis]